ncbi:nitroreductase family protein [Micromonospora sp. HM5-17]|uniref:nitroreductase family protein n=1 Tax=Micromonospora sp. HM5-17 TaxID=2487710 RepID=UPI000F4695CD|nr:nitroreductase family protein [Micromonospora sp. HM5-17]ROT27989.1 nitroreductase [Micromonospora sp. HM5-17]
MAQLSPLLAARWSPHAFNPIAELTDAEVASLLEAARWAPSHGNSQPWRFLLGRRDDEAYKRILTNVSPADQRWAGRASALLLAAHVTADAVGAPLTYAAYDLGQAVAHLTVQATSLRLHVRQTAAFDEAGLRADLDLPPEVHPHVVVAIGRLGDPYSLPEDLRVREVGLRQRRPVAELMLG